MMSFVLVGIFIVLAHFIANGAFAKSEMTVVFSQKSRLQQTASGNFCAAAALRLSETPTGFLPTVLIGIPLIGLLPGAFSGAKLVAELGAKLKPLSGLPPYADAVSVGFVVIAPLPSELGSTRASFIGAQLTGHPREGDSFTRSGLCFEIIDMDRTSVDKVLIQPMSATGAPGAKEHSAIAA